MSRARCDGNYDDNWLTFKLVMVRGTDDPDDGPGHQVHPPRVGKLHQLPGHRHEAAAQILFVLAPIAPMSDIFEIQYKEDQTIRVLKTIMNIRSQLISFLNTSGSKPVTRMLV